MSFSLGAVRSLVALVALAVLAACGAPPRADSADSAARTVVTGELDGVPDDVIALLAFDGGVALVRPGPSSDVPLVVQRARASGSTLDLDGPTFAVRELLDVDAAGNLYVLPARATDPASMLSSTDVGERVVVKVSLSGALTPLLAESRGIWGFGVAPAGDALWSHGCAPTGIFAVTSDGVGEPVMPAPSTQWQAQPNVLTDARTFWSAAIDGALMRTTPDGSEARGTTISASAGVEPGVLSRCGDGMCLRFPMEVVMLDADGTERDVITWFDVDGWRGEGIVSASGNRDGVYVSLRAGERDDAPLRVVFVATQP